MMEFLKDKIYYIMGATVLVIILFILMFSCSSNAGGNYDSIENNMLSAAKRYYKERKNLLPKENGEISKVSINTLVETELLKEVKDPKNSSNSCSGYVEVYKVDSDYVYVPFLTCPGNYEPNYLSEKIKADKPNELGDGVYEIDGEYRYRGEEVNNYLKFNNSLWRIIKVDSEGDIKIVRMFENEDKKYYWDNNYNYDRKGRVGINTDFSTSNVRRILKGYSDSISKENKAKLVAKTLCVGSYNEKGVIDKANDCVYKIENQYFTMVSLLDVKYASANNNCIYANSKECDNRNYLKLDKFSGWLGAVDSSTTYKVYSYTGSISLSRASISKRVPQVVHLTGKTLTVEGNGTKETPYKLK